MFENFSKTLILNSLKTISPIDFDFNNGLNGTSIIIKAYALNLYLSKNISGEFFNDIKEIQFNIFDADQFEVSVVPKQASLAIKQRFQIQEFVIDDEKASAKLLLLDDLSLSGKSLIYKALLLFFENIITSIVNKKLVQSINQKSTEQFSLDGKVLSIDLKNGFLQPLYSKSINEISGKSIMFIGDKKAVDYLNVPKLSTEKDNLIVDIKLNLLGL